jgi:tyrosine-protein kinase Etk/Wzc
MEKEKPSQPGEETDFQAVLFKYLRFWYLFLVGVLLCMAFGYFYLRYSTPMYNASSTILIKDYKKGPELFGNAAFNELDLFNTAKNINNEIHILKSPDMMEQVLRELELNTSYYVEGRFKTSELYGAKLPIRMQIKELDSAMYGKTISLHIQQNNNFELEEEGEGIRSAHMFGQEIKKQWGTFTVLATSEIESTRSKSIQVRFNNVQKLAGSYQGKLNVSLVDKEASVLQVSLTDPVPEKGKDIISKLVQVYNREEVDDKNQIASNTIEFIDERLRFLTTELSEVEKDVEQYKQRYSLTDVSSEAQLYLQKASEYNQELAGHEIQMEILRSIESYLEQPENQFELVPSSLSLQDQTLMGLIMKFNELQLERQRMLRTSRQDHPIVQDMDEQLANLRLNILENLQNMQKGMQITLDRLQASSLQFESRIQKVPSIERELLEINRQQGIKQGLYLYLLQKREEAALSLAAATPSSRVIIAARVGNAPVSPKRPLTYLIAFFIGMGIPFLFIYIRELLNNTVQERKEVERKTNTPILGEIAHKQEVENLVVTKESKTPVAELFRLVRSNLQFATAGKENKVILVTSSMSGEGKTFFSINLAASLALLGKKVVVLDFDFRKPRLAKNLGLPNDYGVTNYLISDSVEVEEVIKPSKIFDNFDLVGSGPVPPNPAELMQLPKVGNLIHALKNQYDYVIIDTSPVGQVADALSLSPFVDSSLYLVRYNYTDLNQLELIQDIYENKKLKHLMIVLNDAKGNIGYGYGYAYGYGYGEEEERSWLKKMFYKS